jgi:hypothetical protein
MEEITMQYRTGEGSPSRPLLLDLYCGAGGAAVGYHRAGFEVIGVDIAPQPNYPFEFRQLDALQKLEQILWLKRIDPTGGAGQFAMIHASPPCQHYTTLARGTNLATRDKHPNLIPPTRELLDQIGLPYVLENVPPAPLRKDVVLCGLQFGLKVFRHRVFELDGCKAEPLAHPPHKGHRVAGWRHGEKFDGDMFAVYGDGGGKGSLEDWQRAMGIDWMTERLELAESIPPAYTEYIGRQLIEGLHKCGSTA